MYLNRLHLIFSLECHRNCHGLVVLLILNHLIIGVGGSHRCNGLGHNWWLLLTLLSLCLVDLLLLLWCNCYHIISKLLLLQGLLCLHSHARWGISQSCCLMVGQIYSCH